MSFSNINYSSLSILNVVPVMSDTIADFLDVMTKNKVLSIKIHTPLPVQCRLPLVMS
jgi:hypothetical protein